MRTALNPLATPISVLTFYPVSYQVNLTVNLFQFACKKVLRYSREFFMIFFSPCTSVLMSKVYLICKRLICSLHAILFIIQIGFVAVLVARFERIHLRLFARKSRGNKFYIIISKKMILKFYCVCTFVSLVDEFRVVLSTDNQCDYYNAVIFSV